MLTAPADLGAQPAGESCSPATWYLAHGDTARALRALKALPGGPASNLRGLALLMEGDAAGALAEFDAAIAADETSPQLPLNRAIALIRLGRLSEAGAGLEAVASMEASPDLLASAAYHRALVADRSGDLEGASTWLDRALEANPASDDALLYAGVVFERRGRFEDAGKRYRDYLARNSGSIIAMLRFGIVAHRAGRREVGRKYLSEVVRRAPESREAIEARKMLILWE